MRATAAQTVSGYNEYVNALRHDKESEYALSLVQFDAPRTNPELTVTYEDRALADVADLTNADFRPRGNTPLYDAIGECIRRIDARDRGVIMLIVTDGEENASTEFTKDSVKALISEKEKLGWTFSFLGANIDSYAVSSGIGIPMGNVSNYVAGHERAMYTNMANATMNRAHSFRTAGLQASTRSPMISPQARANMQNPEQSTTPPATGGRPAAPPAFRRTWKTN